MVQNMLHNLCSDIVPLILWVDDHVPNRSPIDVVRQYPPEPNEPQCIPGRNGEVRIPQHGADVLDRTPFGPGRMVIEVEQGRGIEIVLIGKGDHSSARTLSTRGPLYYSKAKSGFW